MPRHLAVWEKVAKRQLTERPRYSTEILILKVQWKRGGSDGGPSIRSMTADHTQGSVTSAKTTLPACDLLTFFLQTACKLRLQSSKHSSRQQQAKFFPDGQWQRRSSDNGPSTDNH